MFHVTESNKLEGLIQTFKLLAFQKGKDPFKRRIVLVPSTACKNYLKMDLAKDGIAFGLDLFTYEEGLIMLAAISHARVPTLLELTTRLHIELLKSPSPEPLHYLQGSIGQSAEKKLYLLAKNWARLFLNYGRFADIGDEENFQVLLFKKVFGASSVWTTRIEALARGHACKDAEIYVFAPFMTKVEAHFLKKISQDSQVELFSLMPSSYLLDDHLTDREEAKKAPHHFEKNALIANYSKLFRETQSTIIDSTDLVSGVYLVESFAADVPAWSVLLQNDHILVGDGKITLLKALQTDLALMRMPEEPINVPDTSIEVHINPTPYQEIQALYNRLLSMQAKPMDIQVFAKDILAFEPYIKAVFGKKESPLKYSIQGDKASLYPLNKAFINLLEIKKFEALEILGLLEVPAFRIKAALSASDVQKIRAYCDDAAFTWGEDLAAKNAYYQERGFSKGSFDPQPKGTKEDFQERLICRLIMDSDDPIDINEADTIAAFLTLNALSCDLASFKAKHTLKEWSRVLKSLFVKYFETEEESLFIVEAIEDLSGADPEVEDTPCLFMTPLMILKDALNKGARREKEGDLNVVRFSSLLPHHALPGKVIALIGLEEGVFPGSDPHDIHPSIPKNSDTDRHLFMEAILSAREFLYLSYTNDPSSVILDLFSYLDAAFRVNGDLPSIACFFEHPREPESQAKAPRMLAATKAIEKKTIEIKELAGFFRNPLKAYLKGCSIHLPLHKMDASAHPLKLPHLTHYNIKHSYLNDDPRFIAETELLADMPPKLFRDLQMEKIIAEKEKTLRSLSSFGLNADDLFTINLLPYQNSPDFSEEKQLYYAGLMMGEAVLFGKIEKVSLKGLVRPIKGLKELIPAAIELAVAQKFFPDMALLEIAEKGGEMRLPNLEGYLPRLMEIYSKGLQKPLLLLPQFLEALQKGDAKLLEKKIEEAFNPFRESSETVYLRFVYGSSEHLSAEVLIDELHEFAKTIMEPL